MRTRTRHIIVGLTLALLSLQGHASDEDSWISDSDGCKVWNPQPKPKESVTWSGECRDGYAEGEGILQWMHDGKFGSRFEGTLARGKPTGKGSFFTGNGALFDGNFVEGEPSGKGVMTFADGARYEGDWSHGRRTGAGVLTRSNGDRYEGDFVDGKWSGKGVFTTIHGARYEGQWIDNKREGSGTQVFADGRRYEGEWKNDSPTHPESIVRKTYSVKEEALGSSILRDAVSGVSVPVDKTYAELTADEKWRVKSQYEPMAVGDEPPYPLHGLHTILETCAKLQQQLRVRGALTLAVTVNAAGDPIAVESLRSPDPEMAKKVAMVLMLVKYKPAVCKGSPCQMQYPFRMNFTVNQ